MQSALRPKPELQPLSVLVGKWASEGEIKATSTSPAIRITGSDTYEWILGGAFLLHRVDVMMGAERVEALELIGRDEAGSNSFPMHSFDNQGKQTLMQTRVESKGVFTLSGDGMRSTLRIHENGKQMNAHWERLDEGAYWVPWMDMHFTKRE